MVDYSGGRYWELADALTGVQGQTNLNAAQKQGVVHRPASGLTVDIESIVYLNDSFTLQVFNAVTGVAVPANEAQVFIYIDNANSLVVNNTGFPVSGFFVALALVTTSVSDVLQIINMQAMSPAGAASTGVQSLSVIAPIQDSGTPSDPIIEIAVATPGQKGAMSAADKSKLDTIEGGAQQVNQANIIAGGGLHESQFTDFGTLLEGAGPSAFIEKAAGPAGTYLQSAGPGNPLQWAAIGAFAPSFFHARHQGGFATSVAPSRMVFDLAVDAQGITHDLVTGPGGTGQFQVTDAGRYLLTLTVVTANLGFYQFGVAVPAGNPVSLVTTAQGDIGPGGRETLVANVIMNLPALGTFDIPALANPGLDGSTFTHTISVNRIA